MPWRTPRPSWSAFREASFGVSSLELLNDSVAKYSWHRHACNGPNNSRIFDYGMNFSDACVTAGDNGNYSMVTSDETYFVRPPRSRCPNRWVSTAVPTTREAEEVVVASPTAAPTSCSTDSNYQSDVIIGLTILSAVLGVSTALFFVMWFVLWTSGKKMAEKEVV